MRTRFTLTRAAFGAAVAAALASGAGAVAAGTASASEMVWCPGYVNSAQICSDCCWDYHQSDGVWNPSTRYCSCELAPR